MWEEDEDGCPKMSGTLPVLTNLVGCRDVMWEEDEDGCPKVIWLGL